MRLAGWNLIFKNVSGPLSLTGVARTDKSCLARNVSVAPESKMAFNSLIFRTITLLLLQFLMISQQMNSVS